MLLIKQAIEQSRHITDTKAFFKVTGRYPILNISYLLRKATQSLHTTSTTLYCDIKDHPLYDWLHTGWNGHSFDCRAFAATTTRFLTQMAPLYTQVDDYAPQGGCLLEDILFRYVKTHPRHTSLRFPREPIYAGFEGSSIRALTFSQNQNSLKSRLKRHLGNTIRILFPRFYF